MSHYVMLDKILEFPFLGMLLDFYCFVFYYFLYCVDWRHGNTKGGKTMDSLPMRSCAFADLMGWPTY